jgi:hypothetical protein
MKSFGLKEGTHQFYNPLPHPSSFPQLASPYNRFLSLVNIHAVVKSLTNTQIEILESFSFELDEKQLIDFRQMLMNYFADRITSDLDALFEENDWSVDDKVEEWGQVL